MTKKQKLAKAKRAAKKRKEKEILDKQLEKDYNKFIKKNKGWPHATKAQEAEKRQTVIGKIYAGHDRNIRLGLASD